MELFSTWQHVVYLLWFKCNNNDDIADYCPGGQYAHLAGKDITVACAKGFSEGAESLKVPPLNESEKKALDSYYEYLQKECYAIGVLKEKQL